MYTIFTFYACTVSILILLSTIVLALLYPFTNNSFLIKRYDQSLKKKKLTYKLIKTNYTLKILKDNCTLQYVYYPNNLNYTVYGLAILSVK